MPKERGLEDLQLTEGLEATEAGVRVPEDVDWDELRASATGRGITRLSA